MAFNHRCPPPPTSGLYACRNRSLHEVPLPVGAPLRNRLAITALDVSDNIIQILHEDTLKPYPALTSLRLERNLLWKITDLAFLGVPRLQHLLLRKNRLTIQAGSFSPKALLQLRNLQELDLSENPLGQLPARFFPPSLLELRLELTFPSLIFQLSALSELKNLQTLNLANNSFVGLPGHLDGELQSMRYLKRLYLDGNMWTCDCHLIWLARIARRLNTTALCHMPEALRSLPIGNLSLTEFQCAPVALNKNDVGIRITEVEAGSTVTMVCHFYAEPRGRIRWFRGQVEGEEGEIEPTAISMDERGVVEGVLRDSVTKTNLTLREVQAGVDDGVYRCEAENARGKDAIVFRIRVGYRHLGHQKHRGKGELALTSAAWMGVVVGGVLLISLTLLSVVIYCCQKARAERESPHLIMIKQQKGFSDNEDIPYPPEFTLSSIEDEGRDRVIGMIKYQAMPTNDWFASADNEIERL